MLSTLKDSFNRLIDYFKNMEKQRRNKFIILVSAALLIVIAASVFLSYKSYTVLYSDLKATEAGEIMARLEAMGVDAKAQGASTILIESSVADRVRMELAAEGYPNQQGFNYDIYSGNTGLSRTDADQKFYDEAQLGDNIRVSINTMEKVDDCLVIIHFADENVFVLKEQVKPATASVTLRLKEGAVLNEREVNAIYNLVRTSVPGLTDENISIVDTKMNLYEKKDTTETYTLEQMGEKLELTQKVQERLRKQVINMLSVVFGEGRVLAEVNVVLNFNDESQQSVVFEAPNEGSDRGLAVSIKELAEVVRSADGAENVAGFDPNGAAPQYQEVLQDEDALYSQVSNEANYEINETRTQIALEKGRIQDLSVAVAIDSNAIDDDYTEQVQSLVADAIGVNPSRVTVAMLPFSPLPEVEDTFDRQSEAIRNINTASYIRLGIIVGTIIIVLLILLLVLRTLRKPQRVPEEGEEEGEGIDIIAGDDVLNTPEEALAFLGIEDTNLQMLENYIEKSPEAVAQLLRNWLADDVNR